MEITEDIEQELRKLKASLDEDEYSDLLIELEELKQLDQYTFSGLNQRVKDLSPQELSCIEVVKGVVFGDSVWPLEIPQGRSILNFNLNLPLGVLNHNAAKNSLTNFYKLLTFFQFPNNDFEGSKRSFSTTRRNYWRFKKLIEFLFIDNGLYYPEIDAQKITVAQLHNAMKLAKETKTYSSTYEELYYAVMAYFRLIELDMLPLEYHLSFTKHDINQEELLKDVIQHKIKHQSTYYPLNENELDSLINVVFDYSSSFGKDYIQVYNILYEHGCHSSKKRYINLNEPVAKELLNYTFLNNASGNPWFNFVIQSKKQRLVLNGFTSSLKNKIIASCVIVIALLTALRIREIASLKSNCCRKINENEYELTFTRFKTSSDPIKGEKEIIPTPKSVFDAIQCLCSIYQEGREQKNSEYLFATAKLTYSSTSLKKSRQFIQNIALGTLVRSFGNDIGIQDLHIHRLRKTIAWLLISKSEKNIELVRHLLGHKSYEMTLRYVLRNHELVEEVVHLFENHYTSELSDLMQSIFNRTYSGEVANELQKQLDLKPNAFQAEIIHSTVEEYIKGLLEAGENIFINRIPIGGHCVVAGELNADNKTPCMRELLDGTFAAPDPQLCNWQKCDRKILTNHAISNLKRDLMYYSKNVELDNLPAQVKNEYLRCIDTYKKEITKLTEPTDPTPLPKVAMQ